MCALWFWCGPTSTKPRTESERDRPPRRVGASVGQLRFAGKIPRLLPFCDLDLDAAGTFASWRSMMRVASVGEAVADTSSRTDRGLRCFRAWICPCHVYRCASSSTLGGRFCIGQLCSDTYEPEMPRGEGLLLGTRTTVLAPWRTPPAGATGKTVVFPWCSINHASPPPFVSVFPGLTRRQETACGEGGCHCLPHSPPVRWCGKIM